MKGIFAPIVLLLLCAVPATAVAPYEYCSGHEAPVVQSAIHADHSASRCDNWANADPDGQGHDQLCESGNGNLWRYLSCTTSLCYAEAFIYCGGSYHTVRVTCPGNANGTAPRATATLGGVECYYNDAGGTQHSFCGCLNGSVYGNGCLD
jgi:hypothetical protein